MTSTIRSHPQPSGPSRSCFWKSTCGGAEGHSSTSEPRNVRITVTGNERSFGWKKKTTHTDSGRPKHTVPKTDTNASRNQNHVPDPCGMSVTKSDRAVRPVHTLKNSPS